MPDRYAVREVRGIGLGAGSFDDIDTHEGRESSPTICGDEAERMSARLNAEHRTAAGVPVTKGVSDA